MNKTNQTRTFLYLLYYPDIHTCMIIILITISTIHYNGTMFKYITILTDQEALDIQHKKKHYKKHAYKANNTISKLYISSSIAEKKNYMMYSSNILFQS